ncbi:MAG TPA: protease pro-enzyme activation domain-containing protein [Candidatus Binataceae bacterium]|nr:protease pro-enzyme activation domain-containing protein [Candidatus Binataceae bacterium]
MLTKPARMILTVAIGLAMLFADGASATRLDVASVDKPSISSAPMVRLPGHVLPALAKARLIKSAPDAGDSRIALTLTLKRDDQAGFERYLHDIYDPKSPLFHRYLTQPEIAGRFGPSQAEYDQVVSYLEANGFKLKQGSVNRLTLTVEGTRAEAEKAFSTRIVDYQIGMRRLYANQTDPALPASIAPHVQAILGLVDLTHPHHTTAIIKCLGGELSVIANTDCAAKLTSSQNFNYGECVKTVAGNGTYNGPCGVTVSGPMRRLGIANQSTRHSAGQRASSPLTASSNWGTINGAGQTIGLVEFDTFQQSDVADYLALVGEPATLINQLSKVDVNGGIATPGADQDEVLLDIDAALVLAPGAQTVVYDSPFGAGPGFEAVLNQMIDDKVTVISNSWAYCENETTLADVQGIDSVLQNAAAAGISVFNGAGDSGSTCLDGGTDVVAVPADSPNATAVGGSSETPGPNSTYGLETWWDDSNTTPPAGQGGFGTSSFFARPSYQNGLDPAANRSIPDVVVNADPFQGVSICEAASGGCPTGQLFAGTSLAAPTWAAFTALLNQAQGSNLGFLNPLLYALSGTGAFHDPTALGSDFIHVGLGSPNLNILHQLLSGASAGAVSATNSSVALTIRIPATGMAPTGVFDDGTTAGIITVELRDANGNSIAGKTVTLTPNAGGHVNITPTSAVTTADNGVASFQLTDTEAENVSITANDTTDGTPITQQVTVPFVPPPAAAASIMASLNDEPADGTTADTVTVTVEDSLSRPTPGKTVMLSQGSGNSSITGPSPQVTDANGQIQFSVVDTHTENVTYTATDVTDGSLPVPGSATVDFTNGSGGCNSASYVTGAAAAASGYAVSAFATGFEVNSGDQGFSYNCFGAYGMAWDSAGNLYVTDWPTGNIYKFDSSGGAADASHLFATVKAPATGLAIDPAGNMFASEGSVSGANGDIVPVDLSNGTVGTAIASGFPCLGNMAIDPAIPALYVDDFCSSGPVSPDIWQITGIDGASPTTTVYAQTPDNIENFNLAVAPDGTVYDIFGASNGAPIARITPGSPPTVTLLTTANGSPVSLYGGLGMTVGGKQANDDAQFVLAPFNSQANGESGLPQGVQTLDLTGSAPAIGQQLTTNDFSGLSNFAIGPDGCLYVAGGPTVSKITNADGTCEFGPTAQPLTLSLTPITASPTQGGSQNLAAAFHYGTVPAGTPVMLDVNGVNTQTILARTDSNGTASFSLKGAFSGSDVINATATVNNSTVTSNSSLLTWESGPDTTALSLNLSPKSGMPGDPITLMAALTDVSQDPAVPVVGQSVTLELGNNSCSSSTNSTGIASCQVNPEIIPGVPSRPITASFAGTADLTAANASTGFTFTAPPEDAKLRVTPKALDFPAAIEMGGVGAVSKPHIVTVFNPKNKKQKLTVTFLGAEDTGDFTIVSGPPTTCNATLEAKARCKIALVFSPTTTGARTGTLMVDDNADLNNQQMVKLNGKGEQGKLSYSPAILSFGKLAVDSTSKPKTVKIANHNPVAMSFAADTSGDYQITSNTCASTLPAKSTCEIEVTFEPTGAGSQPGTLTFTDDAARSPQTVKLEGSGE